MMRRRGHLYYYCHDEGRNLTFIAKTAPPRIHHQTSRIKCAFWCLTLLVGLFSSSLFACWVSRLKQPRLLGYSAQAYLLAGFLDKQQTQLKLICLLGFFLTHNKQQTTTPAQAYLLAGFLFNKQQTTNNKQQTQFKLFACWVSF